MCIIHTCIMDHKGKHMSNKLIKHMSNKLIKHMPIKMINLCTTRAEDDVRFNNL